MFCVFHIVMSVIVTPDPSLIQIKHLFPAKDAPPCGVCIAAGGVYI